MIKFVTYRDKKKEWRCKIIAQNGKNILREGYKRQGHLLKMIQRIILGPHKIIKE